MRRPALAVLLALAPALAWLLFARLAVADAPHPAPAGDQPQPSPAVNQIQAPPALVGKEPQPPPLSDQPPPSAPGDQPPLSQPAPNQQDEPPPAVMPPDIAPPAVQPRPAPRRLPGLRSKLEEDSPDRVPLALDRQTLKELETATEQIGKQQYPDAIHHLQRVLDSAEDSWIEVPGAHAPEFRSAKRQAADRIGKLPAAARDSYETEYGQVARQMLDEALRRSGGPELADVVNRYFHTRAGYKAAYALGNRLFDSSMPVPAAGQFERLRKSPGGAAFEPMLSLKEACCWLRIGAVEKGRALLAELKRRPGGETVTLRGQRVTIPDGNDVLAWLEKLVGPPPASAVPPPRDWLLAGGSPARNAPSGDALPLGEAVWTQSLIKDHDLSGKDRFADIETALEEYRGELTDSDMLTIPSGAPLVVGNAAVFRTFARLRAVDLRTGEPLWDFAERDRLYSILAAAQFQSRRVNRLPVSMESREQDELKLFFNARAFRDMTYAGLSSDGERVFAILDGGFLGLDEMQRNDPTDRLAARNHNVLAAVDLATGRLLWELGGGRSDRNRDLAGTFFLGCGLPLGSSLYALGELDGEISLLNLDPATGKRIYTQRLATPLGRLGHYPLRRLAGGNPSSAAGLLVCPTTGGVVTAFDPASRTLAWEYRYQVNRAPPDPRSWVDDPLETNNDESSRWLDSAPVIAGDAVLLTPRDSDELHCLNLDDGSLRWKQPRANRLFLAAVADGLVYIAGHTGLEAVRVKDGAAAWDPPLALNTPSGRGYRSGSLYHLPLSTGELATIDLRRGRILSRTPFERTVQPGNLVSAQGTVLMESAGSLEAFRPTAELENSIAKTLEQHPDDAAALAMRGELRLHRGQTEAGLEDLTRSVRLHPDERTESIAVATVLEKLRFDFAGTRELAERLAPQITDPRQRVEFHQLMAAGLVRAGDVEGALDHDLQLLEDESLTPELLPVGEALKVQVSQVVAPELAQLFSAADPDRRARLTKKIEAWTARVAERGPVERLQRAIGALEGLPVELDLRGALVARLTAGKPTPAERSELFRQLTHLRQSPDSKTAGPATARLARILIDQHRPDETLSLLAELGDRFKSVSCADSKTGGDLARAWLDEPAVKAARARVAPWPGSELSVNVVPGERPPQEPALQIRVDQCSGPFYRGWRFEARRPNERGFTLAAIDASGNERWQLELTSKNLGRGAWGDSPLDVRISGPFIEVALRRRIVLLGGLDGTQPPDVLWSRELFDPHWSAINQLRSEMGLTSLVTPDRAFYQIGAALCAADLVSGRAIWERRNIPFPYSLVGDQDYVIALNRNETMDPAGLVLRGPSGAEVFNNLFGVPGPLAGEWRGPGVVMTTYAPRRLTRSFTDLVSRKVVWSQNYAMPAWPLAIDDDEFAVLDSAHRLHVHSAATGSQLFVTDFDPPSSSPQLSVRHVGSRYIVIRQSASYLVTPRYRDRQPPPDPERGDGIWAINADTGKVAWSVPLTPPQALADLPAQAPVLVLVRPASRFELSRPGGVGTHLTILDARTGKSVYEGRESTSADRVAVRLDADARKVIVTTDKHRLEITPKVSH
jgi:outer membrane protein assembly factor BamB